MTRPAIATVSTATFAAAGLAALVLVAACSQQPAPVPEPGTSAAPATAPASSPPAPVTATPARPVLTLDGLADLRFGQSVPAGSDWTTDGPMDGAPADNDACLLYSSPRWPKVYAIVEGGTVRRITLQPGSSTPLAGGLAPGASETAVRRAFPALTQEGHAYSAPSAKYLTTTKDGHHAARIMFEIGEDGKVAFIHAGLPPTLGYVEGCS